MSGPGLQPKRLTCMRHDKAVLTEKRCKLHCQLINGGIGSKGVIA